MKKEKIFELIELESAGKLSVSEKQKLQNILDTDPEARKFYEEEIDLNRMINGQKNVPVDIELKDKIIGNIDQNKYMPEYGVMRSYKLNKWMDYMRYGFSFAAGIAAMILIYIIVDVGHNNGSVNGDAVRGTIASKSAINNEALIKIELPDYKASFWLVGTTDSPVIACDIESSKSIKTSIIPFESGTTVNEVKSKVANSGSRIEFGSNDVNITNAGVGSYDIKFSNLNESSGKFKVVVSSNNNVLKEAIFQLKK
jgi:hypothetical protein